MINQEQIIRAKINALYGEKIGQQLFKIWIERSKLWIELAEKKNCKS
jgi:hypothetical protein